jgi:hypothetical protein
MFLGALNFLHGFSSRSDSLFKAEPYNNSLVKANVCDLLYPFFAVAVLGKFTHFLHGKFWVKIFVETPGWLST